MRLAVTSALTGLILLLVILELLRRRQLREKYAMLWLTVIFVIVPVAVYPRMLDGAARFLGIASGARLRCTADASGTSLRREIRMRGFSLPSCGLPLGR